MYTVIPESFYSRLFRRKHFKKFNRQLILESTGRFVSQNLVLSESELFYIEKGIIFVPYQIISVPDTFKKQ